MIFEHIIYTGIDYRKSRGGIGSVLKTYSQYIKSFNFIPTTSYGIGWGKKLWYALSSYLVLIAKLINGSSIKIVHVHSASGACFWRNSVIILISRFFRKKVVFHCHGGGFKVFYERHPRLVLFFIRKSSAIIALSEEWKEFFCSIGCNNVWVVNNIIPEVANEYIKERDDNKLVHLLFLGTIVKEKGVYDLINVVSLNQDLYRNNIRLHIGGLGESENLLSLVREKQIDDIVVYEGWVDDEKKQRLLSLSDVLVLPSYMEGVPISILEAESYFLPIIASNVGGIPSIVKSGESGILVEPGDILGIHNAIMNLVGDANLRRRMGMAGNKISLNYQPNAVIGQLEDLYNSILKG